MTTRIGTQARIGIVGLGILAMGLVGLFALLTTSSAGAVADTVAATGTNNAKITLTLSGDSGDTADMGTALDPDGSTASSTDTVTAYVEPTGDIGAYYAWEGSGGSGLTVKVKSNKVWDGSVGASENSGTAGQITIANGSFTFTEDSDPASYADCDAGTDFVVSPAANAWKDDVAKGVNSYVHRYCLRTLWTDDPGTFISTVTYTVIQP